ncbi:hypothetical protein ACFYSF_22550 [Streptomyces canus]|uniref:hypothetical protein n=1 Tax=Streptomyces canus TaxID=58343 RepID=UPI0036AA2A4C
MYPHYDTPTERAIAYTAGLIDSAGGVTVLGRAQVAIAVSGWHDSEALVAWLAHTWQMGKAQTHADRSVWRVTEPRAVDHLLALCLPDLRVKRRQAIEVREWVKEHADDPSGLHWTPGEDRWLLDHWHHSNGQIAEALGRSENAIPHRRRALRPDARRP